VKYGAKDISATGQTIYTTPMDKDFYLVAATLSFVKDAACDAITSRIHMRVSVDGVVIYVLTLSTLTLTAQNQSISVSPAIPIKLDRNTVVSFVMDTYAAGLRAISGTIIGYTVETTKGV
jgi:hypothetical protein